MLAFLKEGLDSWASNYFTNPLVAFPVAVVPLCCFGSKKMKSFVVNRGCGLWHTRGFRHVSPVDPHTHTYMHTAGHASLSFIERTIQSDFPYDLYLYVHRINLIVAD